MKYVEIKNKWQEEINKFPIFWAFNEEQLQNIMKKLNVTDKEDLRTIGGGSVLKKEDTKKWYQLMIKQRNEMEELIKKDDEFVKEMFEYELANYEYAYNQDIDEILENLGLNKDKLFKEKRIYNIFKEVEKKYLEQEF